jgi:hypothetical protein
MPSSNVALRYVRLTHLYLGIFISPAILFFAFTGALQTLNLHQTTIGSNYKPPAWALMLSQIHKKQTPIVPIKRALAPENPVPRAAANKSQSLDPTTPQTAPAAKAAEAEARQPHNAWPLKIFFLLVAIGLFTSTFSGLYMSYKYMRNRRLVTAVLVAGIAVPILVTIF